MWVPTEKEALMKHRVCIQLQISQCGFFPFFFGAGESVESGADQQNVKVLSILSRVEGQRSIYPPIHL